MSAIDKQLIGSNFCGLDCIDNNNPIHPETCTENIKITHDSNVSLDAWLEKNAKGGFGDYTSMKEWLADNFSTSSDYNLPIASTSTLGGIKFNDQYFNIDNTGVLSLNSLEMKFVLDERFGDSINIGILENSFGDSTAFSVPKIITKLSINSDKLSAISYIGSVSQETSIVTLDTLSSYIANNSYMKNSLNNRWELRRNNNTIILADTIAQTSSQITLPYTNYTAGSNININNGVISATDTTYEVFTGTNAGLVPASTAEDTDKYLRSDGTWADPNYNSTKLWTSNGLSDHYFRITSDMVTNPSVSTPAYVPLFTINMYQSENSYKASHLFEITSRLDHQYYGKFLLTYYKINNTQGDPVKGILTITNTADTSLNIVAYYDDEEKKIRVYRKYTASSFPDTFIVSILGQNNPFYTPQQCSYEYYCTSIQDNDIIISSVDIITSPSGTVIPSTN